MSVALVVTDLTTPEAQRRADGEMVLSVTTTQATPEAARNLTDRIKVGLEFTRVMVIEAYQTRAWAALGYANWDEWRVQEFGASPMLQIPREERPANVISLREAGLSIRAIAGAVGADRNTVRKDLLGEFHPVEPPPITGTNGKTYSPPEPRHEVAPKTKPAPHSQTAEEAREISNQEWSRNLATCVWHLATFGMHDGAAAGRREDWRPAGDIYPEPTTPDRMRRAATYLTELADEWESQR